MPYSHLSHKNNELPSTHWTLIAQLRSGAPAEKRQGLETLCKQYHYPLYCFIRRRGLAHHDAQDVLHDFLAKLLRLDVFENADQEKGRLRTLLLVSLTHFLNSWAGRQKRQPQPLSPEAEAALSQDESRYKTERFAEGDTPGAVYDRKWAQELLTRALERLRTQYTAAGKARQFQTLRPVLLGGGSLKDADSTALAAELELTVNALRVTLNRLLKDYRKVLKAEVSETVGGAGNVDAELTELSTIFRS
jgi:DNA-directed RNA polymerase specialized sigma24 family protein